MNGKQPVNGENDMSETEIRVVFEPERRRAAAYDGDAAIGECEFSVEGDVWVIDHTGVRPEYGGRGIAGQLVRCVIDHARAEDAGVRPVCSYAVRMMAREEFADVIR